MGGIFFDSTINGNNTFVSITKICSLFVSICFFSVFVCLFLFLCLYLYHNLKLVPLFLFLFRVGLSLFSFVLSENGPNFWVLNKRIKKVFCAWEWNWRIYTSTLFKNESTFQKWINFSLTHKNAAKVNHKKSFFLSREIYKVRPEALWCSLFWQVELFKQHLDFFCHAVIRHSNLKQIDWNRMASDSNRFENGRSRRGMRFQFKFFLTKKCREIFGRCDTRSNVQMCHSLTQCARISLFVIFSISFVYFFILSFFAWIFFFLLNCLAVYSILHF